MVPDRKLFSEIIYEKIRKTYWDRKYRDKLTESREVLIETDFNNGEDVEWRDDRFYDWELNLVDKQGEKYGFYTGWGQGNKTSPFVLNCYKITKDNGFSRDYEVDLEKLLTESSRHEYVANLKRLIDEHIELEEYLISENPMGIVERALEPVEGTGDNTTKRYFLMGIMGEEKRETFRRFVEKYGLEYAGEIDNGTPGIDIIDTENNRRIIKEWVEEFKEGKYTVTEFRTGKVLTLKSLVRDRKFTRTTVGNGKQYYTEEEKYLDDPKRESMREINYITIGENK